MNEKFIEEIAKILQNLKKQDYKKDNPAWEFKTDGLKEIINNEDDLKSIESENTLYEKNIRLKEVLKKYFSNEKGRNRKLSKWIINDWGGITNVNDFEKYISDVEQFYTNKSEIDKIRLTDSISSRSKVLSFLSPEDYVICDSRNIFALNWLLFFVQYDETTLQLFTPLSGRNATLNKYSLETIANTVFGKEIDKKTEYSLKTYSDFCDIIKKLTGKLGFKNIYDTEMFIFALSVNEEIGIPSLVKKIVSKQDDLKQRVQKLFLQ